MFQETKNEVMKLMATDTLKRFVRSEKFKKLLIDFGSLEENLMVTQNPDSCEESKEETLKTSENSSESQ